MVKILLLMSFAQPNPAQLQINELRYWDKEYEEFSRLTPKGATDIKNYRESEKFYFNKRTELLNKINEYKQLNNI